MRDITTRKLDGRVQIVAATIRNDRYDAQIVPKDAVFRIHFVAYEIDDQRPRLRLVGHRNDERWLNTALCINNACQTIAALTATRIRL